MLTEKKKRVLLLFGVALAIVSSIGVNTDQLRDVKGNREFFERVAGEIMYMAPGSSMGSGRGVAVSKVKGDYLR